MSLTRDDLQAIAQLMDVKLESALQPIKDDIKRLDDKLDDNVKHINDDIKHINDDIKHINDDIKHVNDDIKHVNDDIKHVNDDIKHINDDIKRLDEKATKNLDIVLDEIERMTNGFNKRFDKHEQEMKKLWEGVHMTKYSNDTVAVLVNEVAVLKERVDNIEKRCEQTA